MVRTAEHTPIGHPEPTEETDEFPAMVYDPNRPMIISAWGRKGSGKSTLNRRFYWSWTGDKVCIDVNGDADPGPDAERITLPLPARFPDPPTGLASSPTPAPRNLHFRADPGSATYRDDLDRAVNLALTPQHKSTLVWAGEVGEFMPNAASTGPHMRRLLMQNRHYGATALFDGPRPAHVNPLVIGQSDLVAVYHLPNPDDRERIAKTIGYPPARFHDECETTFRRGKYWYLLWVTEESKLYRMPPLPTNDDD